jgi:catechol 2,3-dioxygenase-like lactoylglutathione lyase family enzyme
MELGVFSISLAVQDLAVSRIFYEKLGFEVTGGAEEQNYLILVNGEAVIGLFRGMFERNILTFNPGWDGPFRESGPGFQDVRGIADALAAGGIELTDASLPEGGGPGHIAFEDPDGNPILIDQHR